MNFGSGSLVLVHGADNAYCPVTLVDLGSGIDLQSCPLEARTCGAPVFTKPKTRDRFFDRFDRRSENHPPPLDTPSFPRAARQCPPNDGAHPRGPNAIFLIHPVTSQRRHLLLSREFERLGT